MMTSRSAPFALLAIGVGILSCSAPSGVSFSGTAPNSESPPVGGSGDLSTGSGGTASPSGSGGSGLIFSEGNDAATPPPATASGGAPGSNPISITHGGAPGSNPTSITPVSIDACAAGSAGALDAATTQALMNGGGASVLRWLYPYDGAVLPRGLGAPLLMWDGPTADALYVHIHSSLFDYKGCLEPTGPNQLQLSDSVWTQATDRTGGASDPFQIELTASSAGAVTGPITERVVVAKSTLKGSIFYNSYQTKLTASAGAAASGGALLRITPGQSAEVFLGTTQCNGCHSVSANGTRLTSMTSLLGAGSSYPLTPSTSVEPTALTTAVPTAAFAGLYPDGSIYVSNANQGGVGALATGPTSGVYETATGTAVTGTGVPSTAMTPSFSPDGSLLVFTDYAINSGRGLALMNFDGTKRMASGYRQLYQVSAPNYPAWPFVLPDNEGMVFAVGPTTDFSGNGVGVLATVSVTAPASDLFILDVASGSASLLANAMGFASQQDAASNTTYLPFPADDAHHDYYPTVSPVATGGYFWVFFDSYRHYGNLGLQRQLWGTAVDVSADGKYTADPSHPAFYLTGQELGTGNHRAFTALDPVTRMATLARRASTAAAVTARTANAAPIPRRSTRAHVARRPKTAARAAFRAATATTTASPVSAARSSADHLHSGLPFPRGRARGQTARRAAHQKRAALAHLRKVEWK